MTWWQIILAVIVIFITYIMLTGKKRRDKILRQIISDAYFMNKGKKIYLDGVMHFEAVKKFAEENEGFIGGHFASVDITLDNEEIYTEFRYDPDSDNIEVVSISKEENKKEDQRVMAEMFG